MVFLKNFSFIILGSRKAKLHSKWDFYSFMGFRGKRPRFYEKSAHKIFSDFLKPEGLQIGPKWDFLSFYFLHAVTIAWRLEIVLNNCLFFFYHFMWRRAVLFRVLWTQTVLITRELKCFFLLSMHWIISENNPSDY